VFKAPGIGVRTAPESVFKEEWNGCSKQNGIGVHDAPEYAVAYSGDNDHPFRSTVTTYSGAMTSDSVLV